LLSPFETTCKEETQRDRGGSECDQCVDKKRRIEAKPAGDQAECRTAKAERHIEKDCVGAVMTVLNYGEESVSVAMEEVEPNKWMDKVYKPEILGKPAQLYKRPGYTSV
jgi:4-oxalocrotonate tautomerase